MKLNTKICAPINGAPREAVIRPNQFVAPCSTPSEAGRRIMYLPSIVYTPVLTSTRQRKAAPNAPLQSNKRRLLDKDDMEALNVRLESLFVKEEHESDGDDDDTQSTTDTSNDMGRVHSSAFNSKTNSESNVMRSARFQK